MFSIKRTNEFNAWLHGLKDGMTLIVMVGGGDKSKQAADIAHAVKLAATIEE